ncbi:MAG: NUDIX hydrolase, partial [Bdellovibrionota bacterium]
QVWIYAQERGNLRVLLLKTIPKRGAFWQPVTGGVEPGESFEAAALREAREETGFAFGGQPEDLGYTFEFESQWGAATEETFALQAPGASEPTLDPSEHSEYAWMSPEQALERTQFESNREALKKLIQKKKLGGPAGGP